MSDNPEKIAELQSDKLVETLRSKNLGVPVCRHIESKGHNGQQFVKPEYVIETFPSVEFLKSIKLIKAQIRSLVSVRKELHVETSTVPYLEINNASNNNASAAAASSSPSKTTTSETTLTAEEAESLLQEAAPLFTTSKYSEAIALYSKVVGGIAMTESDATLKQILSRGLSNRSGCFLGLKKSQEALDDARKCVDVRPSWVRAHLRVAEAATELEEYDLAVSSYEAAIKAEDRSGNVPSQKELESKILDLNWKKTKPEEWMQVIHDETNEFDDVLQAGMKTVAPESITNFISEERYMRLGQYLMNSISYNKSSARQNAARRDGLVWFSKFCTTPTFAGTFCASVCNLAFNNDGKKLFGSAAVRDALVSVSKYCTAPYTAGRHSNLSSAGAFCSSIQNLTNDNDNNKSLFGTEAVRDALIFVSKYCTDAVSAKSSCAAIRRLGEDKQKLFGTAAIRDALVFVSKYCTSPECAQEFYGAIINLTRDCDNNRSIFGAAEVRDALLLVYKSAPTPKSAQFLCLSIHCIIDNNDSNKFLFATKPIHQILNSVSKHCPAVAGQLVSWLFS